MSSRIEHVGIVVSDLAAAKAFLGDVLKLDLEREAELAHRSVKFAFYRCGPIQVEVIEPTTQEVRDTRLGTDGARARIEHIAIVVDDLTAEVSRLASNGVRCTPSEPPFIVSTGRRYVMTEPETSGGVMYQLIELDS